MKAYSFFHSGTRLLAMLAAFLAVVTFAPAAAIAVEKNHEDRTELRIKDMHARLKITAAQEDQWSKVAQVMRDNAKAMDELTESRMDHAKDMSAVDDLKSYGEITDAHADGIRKLTPLFATLYDSMSETQKKEADALFRHGGQRPGHKVASSKGQNAGS